MNGEFALTATPSFCVTSNAKTSNIANRRRKRAKGFPLGTPTSNSALLRRVVGISYSQTQRPKVKYDDLRAVCFKLRVAFICSGINGFCNIHIESKTGKNKRFSKTKNDKLPNAQREGRCLTLTRIGFANKISTPRLESAELEAGSKG